MGEGQTGIKGSEEKRSIERTGTPNICTGTHMADRKHADVHMYTKSILGIR